MIHEPDRHTDGQMDRQTPHDDIGRACIAARVKNAYYFAVSSAIKPL